MRSGAALEVHPLWIGPGRMAESNAQQVLKARQIIEGLGLDVATPESET
jgi:uncharacterized protein (DUF849 family)